MHPSANAGGRRVTRWSRELIIAKIREWNERYGEPPCSADWNPSLARWRAQEWRAERYRAGAWPSTNAAKRPFGGSFDEAVRAAGLEPHAPGPRRRPALAARPDVEQRGPLPPRSVDEALLAAEERVREAEARASAAERRAYDAEARAERAEDRTGDARRRARRAAEREARARRARERSTVTDRDGRASVATRLEAVAADADARVRAADDQAAAAARDAREARRELAAARARAADAEVERDAAQRIASASGAADRALAAAEARAADAERRARELASLVCGEPRRLTARELAALRDGGPSGPAVLASALKALGRARGRGDRSALAAALGEVAGAAIRWRDHL